MRSVYTGGRHSVTPGKCSECGSDDAWTCDGRGNVMCDCQACPDCRNPYGFHDHGCPTLREEE